MGLIQLVIVLVVVGVILWLVQTYIPLPPPFKAIITIIVVLFVCIWLLQVIGLLGSGPFLRVR